MNGVEILSVFDVITKNTYNWTAILISGGVAFGVCFVLGIIGSCKENDWSWCKILTIAGLVAGLIAVGVSMRITEEPIEYETRYKVTISDDVLYNEFIEKYDVIHQDGAIFTVVEKGND